MNKTSVLRLVPLVNPWSKATMLQSAGEVLRYQGSGDVLLVRLKGDIRPADRKRVSSTLADGVLVCSPRRHQRLQVVRTRRRQSDSEIRQRYPARLSPTHVADAAERRESRGNDRNVCEGARKLF